MKVFLLLAFSFAIFGFTAAQNYTPIQWNPHNQTLVTILNIGLKEAVSEAIHGGQIGNSVWNWTHVNSVETMSSGETTDYDFTVLIEDSSDQGEVLLDLFLNVDNVGAVKLVDYMLHNM